MSEEKFKRNFRFPAFSDAEGVKLPLPTRHLFEKTPSSATREEEQVSYDTQRTEASRRNSQWVEETSRAEAAQEASRREVAARANSVRSAATVRKENVPETVRPKNRFTDKEEPSFGPHHGPAEFPKTRKERFHGLPEKRTMPVSGHQPEAYNKAETASTSYQKPADRYQGRSYFVPKYVPASLIQDEVEEGSTDAELLASMKKPRESYLGFNDGTDDESTVVHEKTFEKFNQELTDAPKKKSALDKSLGGILEEDQAQATRRNRYFED